jgi:phospholipid/cholesterol/gamma-HCH transport system ATP-binding protein
MNRKKSQRDSEGNAADGKTVRLVKLCKSFGPNAVLDGVNIDFATGQTTVVLGPSGCGKSVMLKHIIGLLRPTSGEVWYEDTRIDTMRESRLTPIRRQFGFLFQQSALFDSISVGRNVAFPLVEHTPMTRDQRHERVADVLELVGLAGMQDKMPVELSGGQRKRVALARAIVLKPKVILYDEPTTGLDPIRADTINELILKLKRELTSTSIVVTHDLTSAFKIADEMVMLYDGRVILRGRPEAFRGSDVPLVRAFLQGEATGEALAGLKRTERTHDRTDDGPPLDEPANDGSAA